MLTNIPPWLNVSPELFQNAMSTGARLGLERANMETQANDAAAKLGLGYANIAGENSRNATNAGVAAAAHALEQAKLDFAIQQSGLLNNYRLGTLAERQSAADALNNYRLGELGVKNRHENNAEFGNNIRRYMHVGNQVVDLSGKTPVSVFSGPAQIDPYERMDYNAAVQRVKNAQSSLSKLGPRDTLRPGAQKELDDATSELNALRNKRGKAADVLEKYGAGFDSIPSAWDTQFSNGGDMQDENDPLGILGSSQDEEE